MCACNHLAFGNLLLITVLRQRFVLSAEAEGCLKQIIQTEALMIPHILRERNSIILLLSIENISHSD